jgi:hypothetical protein
MGPSLLRSLAHSAGILLLLASPCFSQSLPRFGLGAKISTLGVGIEAATAVTRRTNIRGGFNFLGYDREFSKNGIDYTGQLRYRSLEVHFDWFVADGFHISPGLLAYNGNRVVALAGVPRGQSFTLGDQTYFSSPTDPVIGTATFDFSKHKATPMITTGWGNLLSRTDRRFSVNIEGGVVFGGSPRAALNLHGSTCLSPSGPCQNVGENPLVQEDIRAEEAKFNKGAPPYTQVSNVLKFYPVVSIGVSYRIK